MKYINPFSKEGFVNLFADHIIKSIDPKHKTRIQVVDFKSFIVVYGATSSDEVLDLNKLRDTFIERNYQLVNFLNIKHVNIIDLIDYREPLSPTEYYFEYYNSARPIFHKKIINEVNNQTSEYNKEFLSNINYTTKLELEFYSPFSPEDLQIFNLTNYLSISSSFPYGYSLNLGRREFYYGEYICNHLFNMLETDKIIFKFSSIKNEDDDFNIDVMCDWHSDTYSIYPKNKIKSLILDVFDFNLNKFSNDYLNDYNVEKDIQNQLEEKPWLVKDKVKDLILF
jgi:hypothetical protein